ncbi:flavoprotein [Streptomyces sp. NPDC093707]
MTAGEHRPVQRLLVGVTGSLAAYGIPIYLNYFRTHLAHEIRVIPTASASRMLPAEGLAHLCDGIHTNEFDAEYGHVRLARWADLLLIAPATANVLANAAHGTASTLLTSTILAHPRPAVFAPNMNPLMWERPVVQRNVQTLRTDGHIVIDPVHMPAYESAEKRTEPGYVMPPPADLARMLTEALST